MSIKTARTNVKKSLKAVMLASFIQSLIVTGGIILFTYIFCTNSIILAPLLMGEYQVAFIQAVCYIGGVFLIDLTNSYFNIWTSIKLLWRTRNN